MKRWSVLLLLFLLPLTLAPRTSLNPEDSPVAVQVVASSTDIAAGSRVRVTVQVRNITENPLPEQKFEVVLSWTGKFDEVVISGLPSDCAILVDETFAQERVVSCPMRALRPGQQATFGFFVQPNAAGELVIRAGSFEATTVRDLPFAAVTVT